MTMEAHASGSSSLAKAIGAPRCGAKTRRQVNPVNILPVKDLDDAVSMAVVRPDPSPPRRLMR
jgi:hypothetical protein